MAPVKKPAKKSTGSKKKGRPPKPKALQQATLFDTPREVMDINEAANYLRFSKSTLYKMLEKNDVDIPAAKVGNAWRFTRTQLDEWLESEIDKQTKERKKGK